MESKRKFPIMAFGRLACSIKKGKRNMNLSIQCNQNCNLIGTFSHQDNKNLYKIQVYD